MNTFDFASISDVQIKHLGERMLVRLHDLPDDTLQPKLNFSSSEVDHNDITIQLSHKKGDHCDLEA